LGNRAKPEPPYGGGPTGSRRSHTPFPHRACGLRRCSPPGRSLGPPTPVGPSTALDPASDLDRAAELVVGPSMVPMVSASFSVNFMRPVPKAPVQAVALKPR
jgi:hypothetical protein